MPARVDALQSSELLALATRTATANGPALNIRDLVGRVAVTLMSEAGSGTSPQLDVTIEESPDGVAGWAAIAAFTQVTDAADAHETIYITGGNGPFIRAVATIAGTTPSFACGVTLIGQAQNY